MDFFIPGTRDAAEAESVFALVCNLVRESTGDRPTSNKVRSIEFRENGYREVATVGSPFEYETVSCIVETRDSYWIFAPGRGLRKGQPAVINRNNVLMVEHFAPRRAVAPVSQHAIRGRVG